MHDLACECHGRREMKAFDQDTGALLRAVIQPHSSRRETTIANLATKITCWEATIEAAVHHGVASMLYSALAATEGCIPSEAMDLARLEFERNTFQCYANASELIEVLSTLQLAGIPGMPF